MSGFDNEVVVSLGERLQPSTAQAIMLMQKDPEDVSRINHTGDPEGVVSANPSSLSHDPVSGNIYFKATGTGNTGWQLLNIGGGVIITTFDIAGSHTWNKNPNTQVVQVLGWSGGSGGGSGARYASGQVIGPGAGAAGPGCFDYTLLGSDLGSSETVIVGAGGAGGAAVTTDDTDGNNGSFGGVTSFGNLSTLDESIYPNWSNNPSYGRAGGLGLNWAGGNHGPNITNGSMILIGSYGGQAGLSSDATPGTSVPQATAPNPLVGGSYLCNLPGGGGAGIDDAIFRLAADGGSFLSGIDGSVLLAGGAAGVTGVSNGDGSNGADGGVSSGVLFLGGTGGGGGAPNPAGRGGNGGNGGKYGGGGGGGAASLNGFDSGAGGNGGDGAVVVIEYLGGSGGSSNPIFNSITINGPTIMNGAQVVKFITTSTDYNVLTTDYGVGVTDTSAPRSVVLPTTGSTAGQSWEIKDQSGNASVNNITITAEGGALIDDAASLVINGDYQGWTLRFDGTNFWTR